MKTYEAFTNQLSSRQPAGPPYCFYPAASTLTWILPCRQAIQTLPGCQPLQVKEEGKLQGQLNKSDSNQYIRELKDQIAELNHELRCLKGQRGFSGQPPFDGIHIVNHLIGDDESFHSSDEDFIDNSLQETGVGFPLHGKSGSMSLDPAVADGSESETEDSVLETRESNQVVQKERPPRRRESYSTTV